MLANYITIAYRNLFKNKLFSFINILGLTIGMSCFIMIGLYVQHEFSYDKQNEQFDQIYRVAQLQSENVFKGENRYALTPAPLATALLEDYPEVKAATTLCTHEVLLSKGEKYFYEKGMFTSPSVFHVFTIPVIEGNGIEALEDPNHILLTKSLAQKYFGTTSAINQTLNFQNNRLLTVKGVIEDVPLNSHFQYDYITSLKNLPFYDDKDVWYSNTSWYSHNYYTYLVLEPNADYQQLENKLDQLSNRYQKKYFFNEQLPEWFLQPLGDIHLKSQINEEIAVNSDIRYIYLFGTIAFIILLLASINYMNLTTAKSAERSKEVGVRKVLGAQRKQLIYQFLSESFLQAIICMFLALTIVNTLLPTVNGILGQQIPLNLIDNSSLLIAVLGIALLVGGLSGLYPALYLSSTRAIKALQGGILKDKNKGVFIRNFMVVCQFTVAVVLIISSLVVYQQIRHIQQKKLGYNRDQIVYIPYRKAPIHQKANNIRTELKKINGVEEVSVAAYLPLDQDSETTVEKWEGNTTGATVSIYRNYIDFDFIDLFEMEVTEGRNFSRAFPSDTAQAYILNESAVAALGWESAVGKQFDRGKVIGVVKDFHFQPFDLSIEPMFMTFRSKRNNNKGNIALKINSANTPQTIATVESSLAAIAPAVPFEYHFMDDSYNQLYGAEIRIGRVFGILTILALFIAGMGLFGLVTQQIIQRTKEIGIRKVLGASAKHIIVLISKSFLRLAVIATLIAFPIAWWASHQWLQGFAYRIDISGLTFLLAGILTVGITLLTVGLQSLGVALANPVKALKTE